ncbi:hypothetical protein BH09SUM1_BH09SUM1_28650 [soil metagenome]
MKTITVEGVYDGKNAVIIEHIDMKPNTRLTVNIPQEEVVKRDWAALKAEKEKYFPPRSIEGVAGCLKYDGPPKTLREMEEGIRKGAVEQMRGLDEGY